MNLGDGMLIPSRDVGEQVFVNHRLSARPIDMPCALYLEHELHLLIRGSPLSTYSDRIKTQIQVKFERVANLFEYENQVENYIKQQS